MSGIDPTRKIVLVIFLGLLAQSALLGLTDDEAYYWVLAQRPALAYAFHPPAVAWSIALFQKIFFWADASPLLARLPAAACAALIVGLALSWFRALGVPKERLKGAVGVLLSFAGFFALSWMIVPDLPLFLGWMLAFTASWEISFGSPKNRHYGMLAGGVALSILSKYSGVLVAGSAGLCILLWGRRSGKAFRLAVGSVVLGAVAGALPSILWNATHGWASILYQVRDRHEGSQLSWGRYGRFWLSQLLLAGPPLVLFSFLAVKRAFGGSQSGVFRFALAWMLPPALIYCVQPAFSDFKLHWAFVVWWPAALLLAWSYGARVQDGIKWAKAQAAFGLTLGAFILVSCHFPVGGWVLSAFSRGLPDPRWDVTNDFYGWQRLGGFIREKLGKEGETLPVIGSRYQTASQAAFSLARDSASKLRVTLLPRDLKAKDEWPELDIADGVGPDWPKLTRGVLYIADNRYSAGPEFPNARCEKIGRIEETRWGLPAKWIDVWKCAPGG